jgi:flagellar basal-body rod protein FlgF
MDRLLYVSMSGAQQTMVAQTANNNNLANANTTGFRADLNAFRSVPVQGPGYQSRAYAMMERPKVDFTLGMVRSTDREMDVAVDGDGWIAVQGKDGTEAYTRAGNLSIQPGGLLVTGDGLPVMGNGGPIAIPDADSIDIGIDGTISIKPAGAPSTAQVVVDRIKLVEPDRAELFKGGDGLIHMNNGAEANADASVRVISGRLESSNVNTVDALVNMISLSRQYESQVKMMKQAGDLEASSDQLLRLG